MKRLVVATGLIALVTSFAYGSGPVCVTCVEPLKEGQQSIRDDLRDTNERLAAMSPEIERVVNAAEKASVAASGVPALQASVDQLEVRGASAFWLLLAVLAVLAGGLWWRMRHMHKELTELKGEPDVTKKFMDLEPQESLGRTGEDVSYVAREREDGTFIIRIRATNHKILLESDNPYATREEAEEMLAQIHDETLAGNVRRVHKDDETES